MNFETQLAGDAAMAEFDDEMARRRKRRMLLLFAAIVVALIIAALVVRGRGGDAAGTPADGAAAVAPVVTVVVPGQSSVQRTVSATGSLAARVEMPVAVVGEGGQVVSVLVQPGDWARAGQTLAVIERSVQSEQIRSLAAQVEVARADAKLAQAELERAKALVGRGFISKADIDRRTATRDAADARVNVAIAQLGEQRARTGRLDIRAPAAGLVLTRTVEPGQVVAAGTGVLFRMAKGGEMEMLAQVSEGDLARLKVGIPATVTPVGGAKSFTGHVWQISPVVDPLNRQGIARVALKFDPALRPGGFAGVSIVSGSGDAPLLPESAVQSDDKGNYVYVVDGANKARRQDVTIGQVSSAGVAITSGLTGREKVVVSAGAFLNPGQLVKPELQKVVK
ncbi:efflux RND transporter periplasmic adaptor subunit [Sphingobium phenoxybenzoativorans]|uniref:Efflux RND transporter periplasmic adaptor subunit n=1 Tax=Sphingobium phenoxybenzoativorans TaxID=1592790 RepID=A0A975K5N0_9SPHN|nr:efflux RND transporter periplasmic adaptor subunit [Sphingobium phenoxybenzoativorans]QUT05240.1 efflux RND transporter periplasmic adaptor subunit [Sphingobium phenoxybenzoativorans]